MRITPEEIHVQEQIPNARYADGWTKGAESLDLRRHQSRRASYYLQIRKWSFSGIRSILRVEVHQIVRGLVQKHQVHRVFSSKMRPFIPMSKMHDPSGELIEDGYPNDSHKNILRPFTIDVRLADRFRAFNSRDPRFENPKNRTPHPKVRGMDRG